MRFLFYVDFIMGVYLGDTTLVNGGGGGVTAGDMLNNDVQIVIQNLCSGRTCCGPYYPCYTGYIQAQIRGRAKAGANCPHDFRASISTCIDGVRLSLFTASNSGSGARTECSRTAVWTDIAIPVFKGCPLYISVCHNCTTCGLVNLYKKGIIVNN